MLRKFLFSTAIVGVLLATASTASAEGGCGPNAHRGPYGHCRWNDRPGAAIVIGGFYTGRGWWDGHRYWNHRHRWHGGWRYH